MVEFTSIPIKDKEIERINNKELNWIGDNELWQLQEKSDSDYGNLFIVYYRINYKRYNLLNDYQVTEKIDFSDLSEEERVFFLKVNGFSSEFLYQEQDGEDKSVACKNVILKGITYGKSKEELELKIGKEHVGEKIENHIDEDAEYTFSIYNIKGKEGSEVKIFKQPGREYIYVIPHDEYVKYEEAEKNERK